MKWFKKLFRIVRNHDLEVKRLERKIDKLEKLLRDRTSLSVDISPMSRGVTHVVVCGRYKNRDYVEVFSITEKDLIDLIPTLKQLQKKASLNFVDAPMEFKAVLKRQIDI